MGTYVAPAPAFRTNRIVVGLIAAVVVGALALGVALATRAISLDAIGSRSDGALTRVHPGYGTDYPPHNGLAGPSQVGVDPRGAYPAHGGLAGPSQIGVDPRGGYPAHGGLAGPSQIGVDPRGAYPAHGGLAGPSRVNGDQ